MNTLDGQAGFGDIGSQHHLAHPLWRGLDGPAVIVGNHMSTLETFALPGLVVPFKPLTFVVKHVEADEIIGITRSVFG